jgi:hypothetical protein
MGEGVDPTQMCQSLVEKVARSKQLSAAADPELWALFEEWLEELEDEVVSWSKAADINNINELARKLGISPDGAAFLYAKLKQEGRL